MTADKNLHICNQCGKEYRYASEKRRHEKSHSPQFQCGICRKKFSFVSALRRHEKQHERTAMVTCEECKKDFRDGILLKRHIKYAHGGSFTCTKCNTLFNSAPALRTHMQTHKPESEKRYQCSFKGCSKKFNFHHHLKHHELTHSNTKQHFCNVCGKGFIQLHHLKTHLRTHNNDPILKCDFPDCNRTFATEYTKNRHMAKNHIKTENAVSSDSNPASDSSLHMKLQNNTAYYDSNMCPFADLKKLNDRPESIFAQEDDYQHMAEDLSKSNRDYDDDVTNCKSTVGSCNINEKCFCAQITKTLNKYDFIDIGDSLRFNELNINSDSTQLKECCGGNCLKENSLVKDELPEMEYKVDGTVKIKEFLDADCNGNELDEVNEKDKNNGVKIIPFNSCKSVLGNCIVSGNGTIGESCLCAKMAIDDPVTAQEIEDIVPHPKDGLLFET